MLINKISLRNFKNFERLEMDLNKINILVGANASGKSNFIQSIRFLRDIQKYGIENAISLQGGLEYLQNIQLQEKQNTTITVDFEPHGATIVAETPYNSFVFSEYKTIHYTIEISAKNNTKYEIINEELVISTELRELDKNVAKERKINKLDFQTNSFLLTSQVFTLKNTNGEFDLLPHLKESNLKLLLKNEKEYALDLNEIRIFQIPFGLLQSNNRTRKTIIEQFPLPLFDLSEIGIYDFDLKNSKKPASITAKAELEENGENLAIVIRGILEDKEKTREFSNLLTDILPFIKELDVEKSYDKSLLFKVKEKYNLSTFIPSSLLSDGTVSIVSIITALFFENKRLTIFEEPEQGVHPSLIAKLMQLFYDASNEKQIIITTHNPEILKHAQIDDLFLMSRNDNGFASITKPAEMTMVKSFLENELGVDQLFIQNLLEL
jgi:predicted ATPase